MNKVMDLIRQPLRQRLIMGGLVAGAGGLAAVWSLFGFGRHITGHINAPEFVAIAVFSAGLAGLLLSPFFGKSGWRGAALSGAAIARALLSARPDFCRLPALCLTTPETSSPKRSLSAASSAMLT